MFSKTKHLAIVCLVGIICACSSTKEIPEGKRISVLDMPEKSFVASKAAKSVTVSKETDVKNWLQVSSNAKHTTGNFSASTNMKELWSVNFGKGSGSRNMLLARPIVVNNIVYTQDVEGTVSAFDLANGHKIFKQKLKPENKSDSGSTMNGSGLASDGKNIYALTGFGGVFALNASTGDILWRKDLDTPLRASPTVKGGTLLVQTIDNQLFAFDTADGSEIWTYEISAEETVLAGSAAPAYDDQKEIVVAAFSNGELQAFNSRIGYPLWSNNLVGPSQFGSISQINTVKGLPVIDKGVVYATGNSNQTLAANIETGDIVWQRDIGSVNTPLVDEQAVFIVSNNFELLALDKSTGETLWQKPLLENIKAKKRRELYISDPLLINSELMLVVSNGLVLTFNPHNGEQKSEFNIKEDVPFAPVVSQKTILFTTNDADLIAFK